MNTFGHPIARFFYSEYDGYQRNFWEKDLWEDSWKETLNKVMNPSSQFTNTPIWVDVMDWKGSTCVFSCRVKVDTWKDMVAFVDGFLGKELKK